MKYTNPVISALALAVSGASVSAQTCLPVTTVENFDLDQYASAPWYVQQQAENTYTSREQNRCVTAQYKRKEDTAFSWFRPRSWWGYTVDVFNYAENESGNSIGGNLCADYDRNIPSQLKVAPCFLPKYFAGPYWVVDYREGDDGYALISGGQPSNLVEGENSGCGADGNSPCCKTGDGINNSGLWIFTRQPNPSDALVEEVRAIAKQKGFSTSVLFDVAHDGNCNVPDIDDDRRLLRLGK